MFTKKTNIHEIQFKETQSGQKNIKKKRWEQLFQAALFFDNSFVPNDTIPNTEPTLSPNEKNPNNIKKRR